MNTVVAFVVFILSIVITHIICNRMICIGTFQAIFKVRFGIWFVSFLILASIANSLHLVNFDKEEKKEANKVTQQAVDRSFTDISEDTSDSSDAGSSEDTEYDDSDSDWYADNTYDADDTADEEYILPDSADRKLKKSDLKGLSKKELQIARNEIYARHGRMFQDTQLQEYFDGQSWYQGTTAPEDFSEDILNSIEKRNAAFIKKFE
mgnify:CR=1 FL=1